jgi:hypothetical protein
MISGGFEEITGRSWTCAGNRLTRIMLAMSSGIRYRQSVFFLNGLPPTIIERDSSGKMCEREASKAESFQNPLLPSL